MKKLFACLIVASSCLYAFPQQTKLLTAEKHNEYGLVYTLPITAFEIEIVALKEVRMAGPYYPYAKKILADSKVITADETSITIEEVNIRPYGIPDSENRYLMQLKAGSPAFMAVADDGMLLSINKETSIEKTSLDSKAGIIGNPSTGKEYLEFVNEDFLSAGSALKQSQLLGEELMEIRDAKLALTRGTAETMPTDGRQLELMLASLEKQENALTQAFTGNSWKERIVRKFSYVPNEEGRAVLCRLSDVNGFVDAENYSGEPIYVSVKLIEEPEIPVDAKGEEKKLPKDAVIYCIPGTAELSVTFGGKPIFSKNYEMSQFGVNFGLNPAIFTDKKEPSYAIFNPATGGLMELGTVK